MYIDRICKSTFIYDNINYEIELSKDNDFRFIPQLSKIVNKKQSEGIISLTIDELIIPTNKYKLGILGKIFDVELLLIVLDGNGQSSIYVLKTKFKIDEFQTIYPQNVDGKIMIAPIQIKIPAYTKIFFDELTE